MATPTAPKGTRDFYPEAMAFREHIFGSWHATCRRYGFELYDGPLFEHLDLYTRKSGEGIEKQLYNFTDKGGRHVALRPEMTPTLARQVAAKGNSLKMPLRWYSIPRLFRYEKMQRGRLREFFQLNMDILGIKEVSADAELIAAVVDMMRDLGFDSTDFTVHVSSRRLLEELFVAYDVPREALTDLYTLLDKRSNLPAEEFERQMAVVVRRDETRTRINDILAARSLEEIGDMAGSLGSYEELTNLLGLLESYGMNDVVAFDIGIVRGLAYYTGIVFEVFDKRKTLRAIAGGGRYDHLVKAYGGPDTPAVGFAAGDVVLGELMRDKQIAPPAHSRCDVYVVSFGDSYPSGTIAAAQQLRAASISAEFPLRRAGVGKQMKLAAAAGARLVIFTGGEEEARGEVKIRKMDSGEELLVGRNELTERVRALLR
jgi:histidyl-tRNA synthetase